MWLLKFIVLHIQNNQSNGVNLDKIWFKYIFHIGTILFRILNIKRYHQKFKLNWVIIANLWLVVKNQIGFINPQILQHQEWS